MRSARGGWLTGAAWVLVLVLALVAGWAEGFPLPFPELDATVSQALGAAPALALPSGCGRAPPAATRGYRAAGYFPDAALYVDATGAQQRAEYGAQRSMADEMHYPNDYPYRSSGPDYAAFGAPEAAPPQEAPEESALEDDTPMPGDAPASVDSGREPEPLREGERIVEDGPLDVDDTEIIPLAGEEDPHQPPPPHQPPRPRARAAAHAHAHPHGPPTRYAAME